MSPLSAVPDLDQPSETAADDAVLRVRRLPAPQTEPPFDDVQPEHHPDACVGRPPVLSGAAPTQGSLALAFPAPESTPAPRPDLRLVGEPTRRPTSWAAPQPTPTANLPEIQRWAHRFVQATVEVIAGDRPLRQLSRWASDEVRDELQRRRLGSRRADSEVAGTPSVRGVVRSVHVGEPRDGVAEVSAVVQRGLRRHAVALRFEGFDGRWLCTALQVG